MVSTKSDGGHQVGSRRKPAFVDGIRTNRTGRRTYAAEFKRTVVEACAVPGTSLAGVALAHGINANLVRRWVVRARGRRASSAKMPAPLLPVTVIPNEVAADLPREKRVPANVGTIELEIYGARLRLRGEVDADALRSVLAVLAQR